MENNNQRRKGSALGKRSTTRVVAHRDYSMPVLFRHIQGNIDKGYDPFLSIMMVICDTAEILRHPELIGADARITASDDVSPMKVYLAGDQCSGVLLEKGTGMALSWTDLRQRQERAWKKVLKSIRLPSSQHPYERQRMIEIQDIDTDSLVLELLKKQTLNVTGMEYVDTDIEWDTSSLCLLWCDKDGKLRRFGR